MRKVTLYRGFKRLSWIIAIIVGAYAVFYNFEEIIFYSYNKSPSKFYFYEVLELCVCFLFFFAIVWAVVWLLFFFLRFIVNGFIKDA